MGKDDNFRKQFKTIKTDVGILGRDISRDIAKQAQQDLILAQQKIINIYYDMYKPNTYKRKGQLHDLLHYSPVKNIGNMAYEAKITVSSDESAMYRTNPDVVFDLMWNKGYRGLPRYGLNPLDKTYDYLGHHYQEGNIWMNPYWSEKKYRNTFFIQLNFGKYTTKKGTPDQVMTDYTLHWKEASGKEALKKIEQKYLK